MPKNKTFGENLGKLIEKKINPSDLRRPSTEDVMHPCAIKWEMEEKHPKSGVRRLTVDATQRQPLGTLMFNFLDPRKIKPFLVSKEEFIGKLRYHKLEFLPFELSPEGRIKKAGKLVLKVRGQFECPSCGRTAESSSRYRGREKVVLKCTACPGTPKLNWVKEPLQHPDLDDEVAGKLYDMYQAADGLVGSDLKETKYFVPRVWASYRISEAPETDWKLDPEDHEGQRLELLSRKKFSTSAKIDGIVIAINKRGVEKGSGWRVWVSPDGSCSGDIVRAPAPGSIEKIEKLDEGVKVTIQHSNNDALEFHEVVIPESHTCLVKEGQTVVAEAGMAIPVSWVPHDVDGKATVIVSEGSEVKAEQHLAEGFTVRPVKIAMDLDTPGIQALSMETTHSPEGEPSTKLGWITNRTLNGGLSDAYGYPVYLTGQVQQHRKNVKNTAPSARV